MDESIKNETQEARDVLYKTGQGDWKACAIPLEKILTAAQGWKSQLKGVDRPWLCWNVNDDWCLLQQRLVKAVGWTPVVGFDPRVGPPQRNIDSAILIDFNAELNLPNLYPHFPLEFAFLFVEQRIAFWHSDLLIRIEKMTNLASQFSNLSNGETAAVPDRRLIHLLRPWKTRYWELVGCTTIEASRSQFELGAGWWMNFRCHVNRQKEDEKRLSHYYWDHGAGIMYWSRKLGGKVREIPLNLVMEGHFSAIGSAEYKRSSPKNHLRNLGPDLSANFDLAKSARFLNLEKFLLSE